MKRLSLLIVSAVVLVMAVLAVATPTVRAAPVLPSGIPGVDPSSSQGSISTCAYANIGWVICPVVQATATAADYAFSFMSKSFTSIEIGLINSSSGAAQAGAIVRALANGLFVVAFLFIVYSLVTGQGLGNYNLKRMVPRFIIAVIFVQFSYYVCQLMIDISNIIGVGIQQLLVELVAKSIGTSAMPLGAKLGQDTSPLSEIASAVMTHQETAWPLLAALVAVVMPAAIICSVLIVILIIRKVLVVTLALISPIAFVAYLLPNTGEYFSRWLKLFIHTLLIFPIISLLLGAGQIVSASILKAGASEYKLDNDNVVTVRGNPNASATLYLVAAGAAVLPLAGTWYAFKAATGAIDAAGARVSRDGLRRSSRERDEKVKKREQAAMDLNKKSMMLRGINRLQQLNVAQDGSSSLFGKMGGAYRGRGKHQPKSPQQAQFDNLVQQRLNDIRSSAAASGLSPQEMYSQALQRYQDKAQEMGGDGGLSINSYEGIDLKASEAYLLESLGKGGGVAAIGAVAAAGGKDPDDKEAQSHYDKPKENGGGGGGAAPAAGAAQGPPQGPADGYRPVQSGAAAGQAASTAGATVIVQQVQAATGAPSDGPAASSQGAANGTGFMARRPLQSSNETLAKARAAKYVADSQDALGVQDDLLNAAAHDKNTPPPQDIPSEKL